MTTMIEARQIAVAFEAKPVLHGVDFQVEAGKMVAILGPNGCGKSTLLKTLTGQLRPQQGQVSIHGQALSSLSRRQLAQWLAALPQSPQAPSDLTVRDLVEYGRFPHQAWWRGRSEEDKRQVDLALKQTGLETMAARVVSTLSGGERQRVWIAMALAQRPKVVLLDEPTTYLDISHQLEIMELLAGLNREHGLTVVMVLHDINHAAQYADQVVVMQHGQIVKHGTPQEVITPSTLREVFRVESDIQLAANGRPMALIRGLSRRATAGNFEENRGNGHD